MHDIDVVTVGRRVAFDARGWGRVAGGCLPRNHRRRLLLRQRIAGAPENADGDAAAAADDDGNGDDGGIIDDDVAVQEADDDNNDQRDVDGDDDDGDEEEEEDNDDDDDDDDENENEDDNHHEDEEEEDAEEEEEEQADMDEDNEEGEEEEDDDDDADEGDDDDDEEDGDEGGLDGDDRPRPYKFWTWSKQYGNPDILRPHPTHTSSMIVGQDGSYLLLLRLAAALPSPLARIKWDQEEEEGRRVTRGGAATRRRRRPSGNNDNGDPNDAVDGGGGGSVSRRSNELEEDYFVTVNIEAPLQAVMDSVDESQTHLPLLRAGLWDYRTEEEVTNEDPVFATFCAMDVVSLRAGDILSVSFMNDDTSRERAPFPDNAPPDLVNSLTLVKVYGNTMARYERLKSSPSDVHSANLLENATRRGGGGGGGDRGPGGGGGGAGYGGGGNPPSSPRGKTPRGRNSCRDNSLDESNDDCDEETSYQNQLDCEAEEFDRSLTRTARWTTPRNDFHPTPFYPRLHSHSSVIEFPHPGHYLLLGRVALGCRRDATFHSVLSGGPVEGHRAQLSVRSVGGRLLHAVGFAFEDKPRLEWADLSILSENAMFNDVVHVPQAGTELSITATGDCRLHPEGTEVGPFCSAVSQSLSCLLLDDEIMEGNTTICLFFQGVVSASDPCPNNDRIVFRSLHGFSS